MSELETMFVTRVYRGGASTVTTQDVTDPWPDGEDLAVETVAPADPEIGEFTLTSLDGSVTLTGEFEDVDEETNELLGVIFIDPIVAIPAGARIAFGEEGLLAQGFAGDSEQQFRDVVIPEDLWLRFREGPRSEDEMEQVLVEIDDDGSATVVATSQSEVRGEYIAPGTVDAPQLAVGSIRIVESEAELADLEAKEGDAAYVRGFTGLYKYMETQPVVTTYDSAGAPVSMPVPGVIGDPNDTPNWYRTTDAADLLAGSITATHLQVEALSAITADLGDVIAGTLTGVTITGGTFQTEDPDTVPSGNRWIEISGAREDRVQWRTKALGVVSDGPYIHAPIGTDLYLEAPGEIVLNAWTKAESNFDIAGLASILGGLQVSGGLDIVAGSLSLDHSSLDQSGDLTLGSAAGATGQLILYDHDNASNPAAAPHANAVKLYFERRSGSPNRLMMVNSAGTRVQIATF